MTLSANQIEELIDVARDHVRQESDEPALSLDFARALVHFADTCVVGLPCERHYGAIHGQEAEELRAGVEQILKNVADVHEDDALHVLRATRKSLIFLLDRVDARDSLAFREATDPPDEPAATPA